MSQGNVNTYSAFDIANWFLAKNNSEAMQFSDDDGYDTYDRITHLKLQKLLYYAQGVYLAFYDTPLFSEKIWAWPHGPVVPEIYERYKHYGSNPIDKELDDDELDGLSDIGCDNKASGVLETVYDNFNIYTAWQLREMSHAKGSPWQQVYKGGNTVIPNELIKDYFDREVVE